MADATYFSAYNLISDVIDMKKLPKDELLRKLDVFMLTGRITEEEYQELIGKVDQVYG